MIGREDFNFLAMKLGYQDMNALQAERLAEVRALAEAKRAKEEGAHAKALMSTFDFTYEEVLSGRFRAPAAMLHGPTTSTVRSSAPTIDLTDEEVLELLDADRWDEYVALKKRIFAIINDARGTSI